eukprot:TRINITY_DN20062_c0_g1::TRINITY_DN20062_c0_g1_i1::g.15741::m.15741 TRINITY_DN20062_c0_g1::TRINITY_DN20062_c0_g1_i1::g.15741  ORF type:complete len:123 (-),score=-3.02,DUF3579/PF12112.3/0.18 TRINITY_DN20062_c0_g1_i1:266-634(-)
MKLSPCGPNSNVKAIKAIYIMPVTSENRSQKPSEWRRTINHASTLYGLCPIIIYHTSKCTFRLYRLSNPNPSLSSSSQSASESRIPRLITAPHLITVWSGPTPCTHNHIYQYAIFREHPPVQ